MSHKAKLTRYTGFTDLIFFANLCWKIFIKVIFILIKSLYLKHKNLFGEMKQFYKSKNLLKLSFLFAVLFSVTVVVNSCKKDDDDGYVDHVVQFETKITPGGTTPPTAPIHIFKTIVTQVGTNQQTLYDTEGLTWSSGEFFVNSSQSQLNFAANANLPNPDSKLTVTIWIDGEVAETATVTGNGVKSAAVAHSFLEL
ncbi:MAG: hypothetical protein P0Y62_18700 [Candidatus Chryseobacterium colombiense]|nr:hypothetical protein [Chryseobacterium sp.]WEK69822.1 MAG: hypothetical protein P0Y62_18700 [Chryseobacterium sp.]